MKNIDIETFYDKIRLSLVDAKVHAKIDNMPAIIRACRLKPDEVFRKGFAFKRMLYKKWYDEFCNSIHIDNGVKLTIGDLAAHKCCTDLFYGNSIKTIAKNSKSALFATGTDVAGNGFYLISFYGIDEYIRTFILDKYTWVRASPLMMGIKTLEIFLANVDKVRIKELDKNELDFVISFNINKCITTGWPTKQDIVSCFDNKEIIRSIIE